jgi:hypothetical protein
MKNIKHPFAVLSIVMAVVLIVAIVISLLINHSQPDNTEATTEKTEDIRDVAEEPTEEITEESQTFSESDKIDNLTEENYTDCIIKFILNPDDTSIPVTDSCRQTYENNLFNPVDVIDISPVESMCNFENKEVCLYVTINEDVETYGVVYTVVDGLINYIGIYYVPGGE